MLEIWQDFAFRVDSKPLIAISATLVKDKNREPTTNDDGLLSIKWRDFVRFHPICPMTGIGCENSDKNIKLLMKDGRLSLVDMKNNYDFTEDIIHFAQVQSDILASIGACGYVFNRGSPSCGLSGAPVYDADTDAFIHHGNGLFAMVITTLNPHLPVIEYQQLQNPKQAEHFLSRVHFFNEWQLFGKAGWTIERIEQFHEENKYFFLSRAPQLNVILSRLIQNREATGTHPENVALEYITKAQKTLEILSKKGRIVQTMELIVNEFSHQMATNEKQDIVRLINDFRLGKLPRSAPLSALEKCLQQYNLTNKTVTRFVRQVPLEMELMSKV